MSFMCINCKKQEGKFIKVIVGLGNPGKEYENTKHNLGFMFVDYLSKKYNLNEFKKFKNSKITENIIEGQKVIFAKPQTYMNLSGESVKEAFDFYKIDLDNLIVIYDDIDVEKGNIKIRKTGGAGSHKGMISVVENIQSKNFTRIRVGIGLPEFKSDMINYVIGKISKEEQEKLGKGTTLAKEGIIEIIKNGVDSAMNKFN